MMRKLFNIIGLFIFIGSVALTVSAQADGIKPNFAAGDVVSIDASGGKIVLQTKDGSIDAILSAATTFKKVPPDNPKLSAATDTVLSDIGTGDKIVVTGMVSSDKKTIPAKTVYLITKSDISKKQAKEQVEWRTRGVAGRIVSLDVVNKKIVISSRNFVGERMITITPKENIEYRRYKPDSVKFDDAKISNYGELTVGDQVRALGDRSSDGASFTAERIVSGSFKVIAGKITAVDAEKKEITLKDIQTNKTITIVVNNDSAMKKFPAEFAAMMAGGMRQGGGVQPPSGVRPPQGQGNSQQTPPQGQGNGQGGGMRQGGGGGGFDDMFERFPAIALADLKVGDGIAVSSTTGTIPNRVTAIKLVSGVEAFLTAPQSQGSRGQNSGFSIPGLDGFGGF